MPFPCVRTDLVVSPRPNGEGVLIYDPTTDTGHVLEGAAAIVFAACDGTTDQSALRLCVAEATGQIVDPKTVDDALAQLTEAGLLQGTRGLSRRALIGGLVAGAAVVAITPLVTSVSKPASATALSPSPSTPIVNPASATTITGVPVEIPLSATGLDPSYLVYWNVTQPTHGTVTITNTASGGLNTGAYATYTPDPGYIGSDSFDFVAGECLGPPGLGAPPPFYPAPPEAQASCPASYLIFDTQIVPATVSITVIAEPTTTTTTPDDESKPKFTG